MKTNIMLVLIALTFTSCSVLLKWQNKHPDNFAEELIEDAIEKYTEKEIDLTPVTGKERQVPYVGGYSNE